MSNGDRLKQSVKNHPPTVQGIIIGILIPLYLWGLGAVEFPENVSNALENGAWLIPVIVNRVGERFTWSDERIKNEKLDAEYGSSEGPAEDLPIPNNDLVE